MLTAKARGDAATVVQEYSAADVIPNLTKAEEYNFTAMRRTERNAAAAILSQLVILVILTVGLAFMITALSAWLRAKAQTLDALIDPIAHALDSISWADTLAGLPIVASLIWLNHPEMCCKVLSFCARLII